MSPSFDGLAVRRGDGGRGSVAFDDGGPIPLAGDTQASSQEDHARFAALAVSRSRGVTGLELCLCVVAPYCTVEQSRTDDNALPRPVGPS